MYINIYMATEDPVATIITEKKAPKNKMVQNLLEEKKDELSKKQLIKGH